MVNLKMPIFSPIKFGSSYYKVILITLAFLFVNNMNSHAQCPISQLSIINASGSAPTVFEWDDLCSSSTVRNYEIQVLRLYNTDVSKTSAVDITAKVDWSQATTFFTDNDCRVTAGLSLRRIYLTITDGSGFYAWRVRRVYGSEYTSPANPWMYDNPTSWTSTGNIVDGQTVAIDNTHAGFSGGYLFDYQQFDEDKNWIHKRVFGDAKESYLSYPRIIEKVDYANYLLMPIQHHNRFGWMGHSSVAQNIIDFSGRPSFKSLPAVSGSIQYQSNFIQNSTSQIYTANDYDTDGTYNNPSGMTGTVGTYYSDFNGDLTIPGAEGKAMHRTLYYNDGLNRVREIVSPGSEHASDPANDPDNSTGRTIRKFYSKASALELIRMFGDEAPKADYITKITSVDPNRGYSIEYRDEMNRVIATALTSPSAPNLDDIRQSTNAITIYDTLNKVVQVDPNTFVLKGTYAFAQQTSLNYLFELTTNVFSDNCLLICSSCDYKVSIIATDRDDTTGHTITRYLYPEIDSVDGTCTSYFYDTSGTYQIPGDPLAPGTYDITVLLEANVPNATTKKTHIDALVDILKRKLDNDIFTGTCIMMPGSTTKDMSTIMSYLAVNDINGLMFDYLNVNPNDKTFTLEFDNCITLTLPIVSCPKHDCNPPGFAQYMKDQMEQDDINTGTSYFANAYANTGTGGVAFTTHTDHLFVVASDQELEDIITNMVNDGYDCDKLWRAWQNTVLNYIHSQKVLTGTATQLLSTSPKFDWWDFFMKEVGYKFALQVRPYSELGTNLVTSTTLVRTKPYIYFPYDWMSNMGVEDLYCYLSTNNSPCTNPSTSSTTPGAWFTGIKNFPTDDPTMHSFHIYNFYKSLKGGHSHTLFPGSINTGSRGAQALNKIQNLCYKACDGRLTGLVNDVADHYMDYWKMEVEGFVYDNWRPASVGNVNLENVFCKAMAVVETCKNKCDATPDSSGYFSAAKSREIQNAMSGYIEVYAVPPGQTDNGCLAGYENVPNVTIDKRQALITWLTDKENRLRQSLYQNGIKNYTWNPFSGGGSLITSPLNTALCQFDIDVNYKDKSFVFGYSTRNTATNAACSTLAMSFERTHYDSVFTNSETTVEIEIKFNSALAANDSLVLVENIPTGFTLKSAIGRVVGSQMKFAVHGPRNANSNLKLTYVLKAPATPTSSTISGTIYSYVNGVQTQSCTVSSTIVAETCIHMTHTTYLPPEYTKIWGCKVCKDEVACSGRICMKFVDYPALDEVTLVAHGCEEVMTQIFRNDLETEKESIRQKHEAEMRDNYKESCLNADVINARIMHEYDLDNYMYTLLFYDRAGNMVRTVQRGTGAVDNNSSSNIPTDRTTNPIEDEPNTTIWTESDYSTTGRLLRSETRDGGEVKYLYDKLARLRCSQNDEQYADNRWSYTKYDRLGRTIESGEMIYDNGTRPTQSEIDDPDFPELYGGGALYKFDVTFTVYSEPYPTSVGGAGWGYPNGSDLNNITLFETGKGPHGPNKEYQRFLRNRVSYTIQDKDGALVDAGGQPILLDDERVITVYSYDPHGNVEQYYSYIPGMDKVRMVHYVNAITEGKPFDVQLLDVTGLPDKDDNFYQHWIYTNDGVLEAAYSGYLTPEVPVPPAVNPRPLKNVKHQKANPDALYSFYPHNYSLKRAELANRQVGMDYVYTLEGWLKAINYPDPAGDPGQDGVGMSTFRQDPFSEILYYYDGDFSRKDVNAQYNTNTGASYLATNPALIRNNPTTPQGRELYDGNIAASQSRIMSQPLGGTPAGNVFDQEMGYRYHYDELGRLTVANSTQLHSTTPNTWLPNDNTAANNVTGQYSEYFEYDKLGMVRSDRYAARNTAASGTVLRRKIDGTSNFGRETFPTTPPTQTNRVNEIKDDANRTWGDITGLDIPTTTYIDYDETGNVIHMHILNIDTLDPSDNPPPPPPDTLENKDIYIYWTVQNTVDRIDIIDRMVANSDTTRFDFLYDATGQRVKKHHTIVPFGQGPPNTISTKYYIRTADGKDLALYESIANSSVKNIRERYIYGRERLGIYIDGNSIDPLIPTQANGLPTNDYMNFEITDHRGNVRVVIPETPATPVPQPHKALSFSNYYAFGGQQPFRNYSATNYRRGYNGQEKDDDVMGDDKLNYARYWMYNQHYGLRWNMDPVSRVGINKYIVFGDNPIINIDPNGDDWFYYHKKGDKNTGWHWSKGKKATYIGVDGKSHTTNKGFEYLAVFEKDGTNDEGGTTGKVTLYHQDQVVEVVNDPFSGKQGTYDAVQDGNYYMRIDLRQTTDPVEVVDNDGDGTQPAIYWGLEVFPVDGKLLYDGHTFSNKTVVDAYGNSRIRLIPARDLGNESRDKGAYIHGKKAGHNWTHGCLGDKKEKIQNYYLYGGGKKYRGKVPLNIHKKGTTPIKLHR